MKHISQLPKLVVCAGLPRSGSTWIYNAVLMLLRSQTEAVGVFSDTIPEELESSPNDNVTVVVKCHIPDRGLRTLARMLEVPLILSVRDPRDCLVSFETTFLTSRVAALERLKESASSILEFGNWPRQFVVAYEDSQDHVTVLRSLASHLGVPATAELIDGIAEALSLETVRANIARLEAEGVLDASRPVEVWTDESHWHANHCGDGRVGKYVEQLSPHEATIVANRLSRFFERFGYPFVGPPPLKSGETVQFSGDGLAYAVEGFSHAEPWGAWTEQAEARIVLPLTGPARKFELSIALRRGPCFGPGSTARLAINLEPVNIFEDPDVPDEVLFVYHGVAKESRIQIDFSFENFASLKALGIMPDDRVLGVGVRSLRISYE